MPEKAFPSGERVVLGRRDPSQSMTKIRWSGNEPDALNDVEWAEELGAKWEKNELVTYDYPSMLQLLEYYESNDYTIDND